MVSFDQCSTDYFPFTIFLPRGKELYNKDINARTTAWSTLSEKKINCFRLICWQMQNMTDSIKIVSSKFGFIVSFENSNIKMIGNLEDDDTT